MKLPQKFFCLNFWGNLRGFGLSFFLSLKWVSGVGIRAVLSIFTMRNMVEILSKKAEISGVEISEYWGYAHAKYVPF